MTNFAIVIGYRLQRQAGRAKTRHRIFGTNSALLNFVTIQLFDITAFRQVGNDPCLSANTPDYQVATESAPNFAPKTAKLGVFIYS